MLHDFGEAAGHAYRALGERLQRDLPEKAGHSPSVGGVTTGKIRVPLLILVSERTQRSESSSSVAPILVEPSLWRSI